MGTKKVIFKNDEENVEITCEVAKTIFEKSKGLMNRKKLEEKNGMIFEFVIPWHRFFWMKNVKIPLDIIFVNKSFEIIHISEAKVEKGFFYKNYWSHGFCNYVIETKMGFCKENSIKKGSKIEIKKEI